MRAASRAFAAIVLLAVITGVSPPENERRSPATSTTTPQGSTVPGATLAVRVSGKSFVDASGKVIQLRGVNRPGTEFRCIQSRDGFITAGPRTKGTTLAYAFKAMAALRTWNKPGAATNAINTVRIPLNEDCWLGINGVPAAYSGAAYQDFVKAEVQGAISLGMYPILDLHWSAPGSFPATQQDIAPNADHSITFWEQVANAYKDTPAVIFDLFNEPRNWCYTDACRADYKTASRTAWACSRDGCSYTYSAEDRVDGRISRQFQIAGTQQLVDTIRRTGAVNVILVEGLGYANSMDNWVTYLPADPAHQLAAGFHTYPVSGANVNNLLYLNSMLATGGLSSRYPILIGEFGESTCAGPMTSFTESTMGWADAHGYSYTAWGWDAAEGCDGPSLVSDNDSGAASDYGSIVKAHLQQLER